MVTAKAEESDQLVGFATGADDYVTKPYSMKVLIQRIKKELRRIQLQDEAPAGAVIESQGVVIDRHSHKALYRDQELPLTPTEFRLLEVLIRQAGRAFTRYELMDAAIGEDAIVLERTIDVHIKSLRKKLGEAGELIETVRGVGYRFHEPRLVECLSSGLTRRRRDSVGRTETAGDPAVRAQARPGPRRPPEGPRFPAGPALPRGGRPSRRCRRR